MNLDARELADSFDLEKLTPDFYANPYPTYRALREHEPVKRMPNGSWFLTRYDDLVAAYKNTKVFSSDKKKEFAPKYGASLLYEHHTTSLVFNDPPAHTRVRRLIMGALSPRAISGMEPDLIALVDRLLDAIAIKSKVDLIGNGLVALLAHPAEKQRLIENPTLIKTAVEEMLRFESSNQLGNRMTVEPVELGGIAMPAGTPVTLCIGAANRDPAQFADPENLDIGRTPNRHLAFGTGAHQCAGIALARLRSADAILRLFAAVSEYPRSRENFRMRVAFPDHAIPCLFQRVQPFAHRMLALPVPNPPNRANAPPWSGDLHQPGSAENRRAPFRHGKPG